MVGTGAQFGPESGNGVGRYVLVAIIIALAIWGWMATMRSNRMFTLLDNAVGREHAERRCAKQGLVATVINDARPGYLTWKCVRRAQG